MRTERTNGMFSYKFTFDWALIDKLCSIERFDTKWKLTSKQDRASIEAQKNAQILDSVKASLELDGYSLSYEEIGEFLENLNLNEIPNKAFKLFLGQYEAYESIHEQHQNLTFSEETFHQFHETLIKFAPEEQLGATEDSDDEEELPQLDMFGMPTTSVSIGKTPKKAKKADIDELLFWYGKDHDTHKLVKVAVFMHALATQRTYENQSGNVSRIANHYLLHTIGLDWVACASLEMEFEANKVAYKQFTKASTGEGANLTKWVHFYLDCLLNVVEKVDAKLTTQHKKATLAPREKSIVKFIQQHPGCRSGDISEALKIPNPTVKRLLSGLVDLHILKRFGAGPGTNYSIN